MNKIGTLNKISPVGLARFTDNYTIVDDVNEANAILVRSQQMHDMDFTDNLLAIARAGVGVNNIPLEKCADMGIMVFNTPGANANAVKELVFGAMLADKRNLVPAISWANSLEDGDMTVAQQVEKGKSAYKGGEILGKTLCVIGLGGIGTMIANAGLALGMTVYGYDAFMTEERKASYDSRLIIVDEIKEMLPYADYLIPQVHANASTNGMINKEIFDAIKPGAVLLNFARATIVDTESLKEALESGKISKYITDFPESEVAVLPNVMMTPHLGASTDDAEDNCAIMAANQVMEYIENGNLINSVTYPAVNLGPKNGNRIAVLAKADAAIDLAAKISGIKAMKSDVKGSYAYYLAETDADLADVEIDGAILVRKL